MKDINTILDKYKELTFVDIFEIVKKYGLEVKEYDLGKIDGILYKNYIGVNKKIKTKKKRFIVAHEFCHFLLKETSFSAGIYHSKDPKEKRADKFATEILLPKKKFLECWSEHQNIPTLSDVFCVPTEVVEMRLKNLLHNN